MYTKGLEEWHLLLSEGKMSDKSSGKKLWKKDFFKNKQQKKPLN